MKKLAMFAAGVLFGTAGIKLLSSKDAKKVYTHTTAAVLRAKDSVMETVTTVRENAEDIYADAKADALTAFLPVYDNLERALSTPTSDEAYRKGVEMTMVQFNQTLEKLGITEIPALGEKFDPNVHNAVMHVEDESLGQNEVVEVFQKGFKLKDKVIRFAMVKVAN